MKVIKFGGSSIANAENIDNVVKIISRKLLEDSSICVVVSAMGGVTDEIIGIAQLAAQKDISYKTRLKQLKKRHMGTLGAVAKNDRQTVEFIQEQCIEFHSICDGVYALGELSPKVLDRLMSFGEVCSAAMMTAACQHKELNAQFVDSRDLIVTDEHFGRARVDFDKTNEAFGRLDISLSSVTIFPGFVARAHSGKITTLGRNGSDYSATIFGALLCAEQVEIWTDVDGVMTANPKYVSTATSIAQMSYVEAMELSYFGAHVLHAPTIQPVMEKGIFLRVCNTFHPEFPGTVIGPKGASNQTIAGISSIDDVSFVRVQGSGMVGVYGVAGRLFSALAAKEVNLIMISQGSSEHSICFALQSGQEKKAVDCIMSEFKQEMAGHMVDEPIVEKDMVALAVVGENMRLRPGIAGRVFGALGESSINVVAIAQGSSELNISMIIKKESAQTALNAIHSAFF